MFQTKTNITSFVFGKLLNLAIAGSKGGGEALKGTLGKDLLNKDYNIFSQLIIYQINQAIVKKKINPPKQNRNKTPNPSVQNNSIYCLFP